MDTETKIIFMNEDKMVIIEIVPRTEVNPFLSGILLNLILNSPLNGQPFSSIVPKR